MSMFTRVLSTGLCIFAAAVAQAAPTGGKTPSLPDADLGASSADQPPPNPSDVQFIDTKPADRWPRNQPYLGEIKLYQCAVASDHIKCTFLYTRTDGPTIDIAYDDGFSSDLVDNFRSTHHQVRGYFLNGRGKRVKSVPLGAGDWAWFVQEFDKGDGLDSITNVKVLFHGVVLGNYRPNTELVGTMVGGP